MAPEKLETLTASSQPKQKLKRADAEKVRFDIARQIMAKKWSVGEKLPTERDLCDQYRAARNTVRRALQALEDDGLIVRKVGRGTFRAEQNANTSVANLSGSFSPSEVVECRLLFEPAFVALGIANATQDDLAHIFMCLESGEAANELMEFEHWDAEFHDAIVLATHNSPAIEMSRLLAQVRRDTAWGKLKASGATPERMALLKQQHREIYYAFLSRDKDQAFRAMHEHIRFIKHYMFES